MITHSSDARCDGIGRNLLENPLFQGHHERKVRANSPSSLASSALRAVSAITVLSSLTGALPSRPGRASKGSRPQSDGAPRSSSRFDGSSSCHRDEFASCSTLAPSCATVPPGQAERSRPLADAKILQSRFHRARSRGSAGEQSPHSYEVILSVDAPRRRRSVWLSEAINKQSPSPR